MRTTERNLSDQDVRDGLARQGFPWLVDRVALWNHLAELAEQERRPSLETEAPAIDEAA